jgi:peptidoglycan/LPS O-acetylase OafA/YrhL
MRILPAYLFVVLMYYSCTIHFVKGPNYPLRSGLPYCENVFKMIFFVDNFIKNGRAMCLPVSWYLDADMQIFSISLLLLLLYKKNYKLLSKIMLVVISIPLFIQSYMYVKSHNVKTLYDMISAKSQLGWNKDQYLKPWQWIPTYFLGIFVAMLLSLIFIIKKTLKKLCFIINKTSRY